MNLDEALSKPGARDAIIKLADALIKKAGSNAITQFNESVPILGQTAQEKVSGSGISGTAQSPRESAPSMVDQPPPESMMPPEEDPYAAVPIDEGMDPGMMESPLDPAQAGMQAVQDFMAPIMDAAMQGDPNAQALIVQTASQIARDATQSAIEEQQMMMDQQMVDPNAGMVDEMYGAEQIGPDGMPMDQGPVGPDGMPIPPESMPQQNSGVMMDEMGNPVDEMGNPIQVDEQGNPIQVDEQGNPILMSPEAQVADQIVPDVGQQGPQSPVGENSGKEKKNASDNKNKEGVQTDDDRDAKKLSSLNITMGAENLNTLFALARMGKI